MTRPIDKPKVFKAPAPSYDRNSMYSCQDGRDWIYEPLEPFTKVDVCVPGYLNAYREELRVGSRITCRLGEIADGITEVELQVIACPRNVNEDVLVAVGASRRFTPCRTDGSLDEDKEQAA